MDRKGFPETYDLGRLAEFVSDVRAGRTPLRAPVYSHLHYDVTGEEIVLDAADVVILEGLNVLDVDPDFSIYLDASEDDLFAWFLERFAQLRETAFRDPQSFFHGFATMPEDEAMTIARDAWTTINLVNLHEHILPTRERAHLVLEKGADHAIRRVVRR